MSNRHLSFALIVGLLLGSFAFRGDAGAPPARSGASRQLVPRQEIPASSDEEPRRPIALVLADDGSRLLVANRDTGSLTEIDATTLKPILETRVGRRLSSIDATTNHDIVLATDEEAGTMIRVHRRKQPIAFETIPVGASPVEVRIHEKARLAAVACLWPRRIHLIDLDKLENGSLPIDLPFAPRKMLFAPGTDKLIVADSFGGKIAVVDVGARKVDSIRGLATAHNIRGLALDQTKKRLLVTHQVLHAQGRPNAGDIRSGSMVANEVRVLSLANVLDPLADLTGGDRVYSLGDVEKGAGDPADLIEADTGELLIAIAGADELAIGRPEQVLWTRLDVGRRPIAIAYDPVRKRAYVANTFGDSISVVDLAIPKVVAEIRLAGTTRPLRPDERGEALFHDARLSLDGWFSCHSCHTNGHTNGQLNDNFTDGSFGTPKRVLSLLGVKDTGPWAWNGKMPDLETQTRTSLKSTMQGKSPSKKWVDDLVAYLKTLSPPPAVEKARKTSDDAAIRRGERIFGERKCAECHKPPTYTSPRVYDVGLRDEAGLTRFNPPSLRGLSQGGPYFHDNRARTLAEVLTRFRHQLDEDLSPADLGDLLRFLSSL